MQRRSFLGLLAAAVVGRRLPPPPVFTGIDLARGPDHTAIVVTAGRAVDHEAIQRYILQPGIRVTEARMREDLQLPDDLVFEIRRGLAP